MKLIWTIIAKPFRRTPTIPPVLFVIQSGYREWEIQFEEYNSLKFVNFEEFSPYLALQ